MSLAEQKRKYQADEKQKQEQQAQLQNKHKKFLEQLKAIRQSGTKHKQQEEAKRQVIDQTNHDFVLGLDEAVVTIPDEVVAHNLAKAGCDCPDLRVRRLIGIAAKKMIFDICSGAKSHRAHHILSLPATKQKAYKNKAPTLEMEYLLRALRDKGISLSKPPFYVAESNK